MQNPTFKLSRVKGAPVSDTELLLDLKKVEFHNNSKWLKKMSLEKLYVLSETFSGSTISFFRSNFMVELV